MCRKAAKKKKKTSKKVPKKKNDEIFSDSDSDNDGVLDSGSDGEVGLEVIRKAAKGKGGKAAARKKKSVEIQQVLEDMQNMI